MNLYVIFGFKSNMQICNLSENYLACPKVSLVISYSAVRSIRYCTRKSAEPANGQSSSSSVIYRVLPMNTNDGSRLDFACF